MAACIDCGAAEGPAVELASAEGIDGLICAPCLACRRQAEAASVGPHAEARTGGRAPAVRRIVARPLAGIEPTPTRWLWEGRVPLGSVTILAGRQGLGKSTLLTNIAADLSRGRLAGDLSGSPAGTLVASYEDAADSVLVPRATAAGADLGRIASLDLIGEDGRPDLISVPGDLDLIGEEAARRHARLLIVDPLMAAIGGATDTHRDGDVRRVLAPLAAMAEEAEIAVICVLHLRKSAATDALDRVSGSVAFTAAARSVLAFGDAGEDEDGEDDSRRVLAHAKCNLASLAPSLAYRIESATVRHRDIDIPTSRLLCDGEVECSAGELLSPPAAEDRTEVELAGEWLLDELADGEWRSSRDIKEAARSADIRERTLQRAKDRFGVEDRREGFPAVSEWRLPVAPGGLARQSRQEGWHDCENGSGKPNTGGSDLQSRQKALSGATGTNGDDPDRLADAERIARELGVEP